MVKLINNLLKCYFKASFGILVTHIVMPMKPCLPISKAQFNWVHIRRVWTNEATQEQWLLVVVTKFSSDKACLAPTNPFIKYQC